MLRLRGLADLIADAKLDRDVLLVMLRGLAEQHPGEFLFTSPSRHKTDALLYPDPVRLRSRVRIS